MYKLHMRDIPAPRDINPDVPEALDAICRRALAFDVAERYQSAGELRDAIESYLETLPGRVTRRAVGERMVRIFDEERSEVRRIVEKQLGRMANASAEEFAAAQISDVALPRIADSSVSGLEHTATKTDPTKPTSTLSIAPAAPKSPPLLLLAVALLALLSLSLTVFVLLRTQSPTTNATLPTASAPPPPVTTSVSIATTTATVPSARASVHTHVGKPRPTATPTVSPTDIGF
jgi:hypothetical protein